MSGLTYFESAIVSWKRSFMWYRNAKHIAASSCSSGVVAVMGASLKNDFTRSKVTGSGEGQS
jgi:hypothetical protein